MMRGQTVLVTGATGATGGYTIDALIKFDVSVGPRPTRMMSAPRGFALPG